MNRPMWTVRIDPAPSQKGAGRPWVLVRSGPVFDPRCGPTGRVQRFKTAAQAQQLADALNAETAR